MKTVRPVPLLENRIRRVIALILFAILTAFYIFLGGYSIRLGSRTLAVYELVSENPYAIPSGYIRAVEVFQVLVTVFAVVSLISIIVYLLWFGRAYSNMDRITQGSADKSKTWTILGWILPPVSFLWPAQMWREMFAKQGKVLRYFSKEGIAEEWRLRGLDFWVISWWVIWLLLRFVENFVTRMLDPDRQADPTPESIASYFNLVGYMQFCYLIPLGMAIYLIFRMGKFENAIQELWTSGEYMEKWHSVMEAKGFSEGQGKWFKPDDSGEKMALDDPFENNQKGS